MKAIISVLLLIVFVGSSGASAGPSYPTPDTLIINKRTEEIQILLCFENQVCREFAPVAINDWRPFMKTVEEKAGGLLDVQPASLLGGAILGATLGVFTPLIANRVSRRYHEPPRRKLISGLLCLTLFPATTAVATATSEWLWVPANGPQLMRTIAEDIDKRTQPGQTRTYQLMAEDAQFWSSL